MEINLGLEIREMNAYHLSGGTKRSELKVLRTFAVKHRVGSGGTAAIIRNVKYRISIAFPLKKEKIGLYQMA
jgi:hypothetical protein